MTGQLVDRICAEHDNILYAVEGLRERPDVRRLLLVTALIRCREGRGIVADSRELLTCALDIGDAPAGYRTLGLEQAAWLAAWHGDHAAALALAHQAVDSGRLDDPVALCRTLNALGFAQQVCGDLTAATGSFAEALQRLRPLGEPAGIGLCLHNMAWATMLAGDLSKAAELLDEAMPIYRDAEPRRRAAVLHTAGVLALEQGRGETAESHFGAALRQLGERQSLVTPYLLEGFAVSATGPAGSPAGCGWAARRRPCARPPASGATPGGGSGSTARSAARGTGCPTVRATRFWSRAGRFPCR